MKKLSAVFGMLLLGILLTGCPYESSVPINKTPAKFRQELLGKWVSDDGKMTIGMAKTGDSNYSITVEEGKPTPDVYYGYLADINGSIFMNLSTSQPGTAGGTYHFYKIELPGSNSMVISPVTGNIREKFSTSEEWGRFVKENMKNSYFYEESGTFHRAGN
jgi:hypothetical protein